MVNIFSEEGSLKFKNSMEYIENTVPTLTKIDSLNKVRNIVIGKQGQLKNLLDNPTISPNQTQTVRVYIDKTQEVLNLINARINEINRVGGKSIKSRKSM